MANKRELDLQDFMTYGWNYIKFLLHTNPINAQYNPTKINVNTNEQNQDNNLYNSNDENAKYNNVMNTDEINKLLYSEKTMNIINGNLLCFLNIIL